jgi:hypothetical protein
MPDDPKEKRPHDSQRIDVSEKWEVDYWSKALGVTPERLKEAVKKVGVMADDVRRHLQPK